MPLACIKIVSFASFILKIIAKLCLKIKLNGNSRIKIFSHQNECWLFGISYLVVQWKPKNQVTLFKMKANYFYLILIFLVLIKSQKVSSASTSLSSFFKLSKNYKPNLNGARNGFAQVSIWGNSSIPSVLNSPIPSILNSPSAIIANDDIGGNFLPQYGPPQDFSALRPMKANQKFKHFNLRLGNYFHLQGTNAAVNHQVYYK